MALQNFIARRLPAISAAWLNAVDVLKFTVFDDATTKAAARTALQLDTQTVVAGTASGTANAVVATLDGPITTYVRVVGSKVTFVATTPNTGAATLNVDGTGVAAIVNQLGSVLVGGELALPVTVMWNGTQWRIVAGGIPLTNVRTTEETAAAVVPVNYLYLPGHLLRYGNNSVPGTTDMTVPFQNMALVSLSPYVPQGTYLVTGSISIRDDQHWIFDGAYINITGTVVKVLVAATGINDWTISGSCLVRGDNDSSGSISGNAAGLSIADCMRFRVSGFSAGNIKGWGILIDTGAAASRAEKGQIIAPQCYACYRGISALPGTGAEYVLIVAPNITRCNIGVEVGAGNINVTNGSITDNFDGVTIIAGSNHAHGSFVGTYINHNSRYAIRATDVTFGHNFIGCHVYEGDIWFENSDGIYFKSCTIDVENYYFQGNEGGGFIDCALPDAYTNIINNDFSGAASYTVWLNNKKLTGEIDPSFLGNIIGVRVVATSAGITITPATLAADTTLLLTDSNNTSANNATQTLFDGYSAATGIYTSYGLGNGHVRVTVLLNVATNAADDGLPGIYAYIAKNGTTLHRWMSRTRLTTTKTVFTFDGIIEMDETDTIRLRMGGTVGNDITIGATETTAIVEGL